jgi:hypothetical protein
MTVGSDIKIILRLLPQEFEKLQCWCYWWEEFAKYNVEMALGDITYIHTFMTIGLSNIKDIASTIWEGAATERRSVKYVL